MSASTETVRLPMCCAQLFRQLVDAAWVLIVPAMTLRDNSTHPYSQVSLTGHGANI